MFSSKKTSESKPAATPETAEVEVGPKAPLAEPPAPKPVGPVVGRLPEAPAASTAKGESTVIAAAAATAVTSAGVTKPSTVKGKEDTQGSKPAAPKAESEKAAAASAAPQQGKAAALAKGTGSAAAAKAGAPAAASSSSGGAATAEAAPKKVPKASAAAIIMPGEKNITGMERKAEIGSVVAVGKGAEPAPQAAPKAKAKAIAPKRSTSSMPTTAAPQVAPSSVLNIVSQAPKPAIESGPGGEKSAAQVAVPYNASVKVGPARAFAGVAAARLADLNGALGASETIPKEGPAAMAVGRAATAGLPAVVKAGSGKPRTTIDKKYQIVFVTSEVAPFSKTGGLGEAMDGLPTALAALGHRVMVISPRYDQYEDAWDTSFWSEVTMGGKPMSVHFFHTYKQKVDYVFADHETFLERVDGLSGSKLYGPEWGKDFADNQARFAYFCKAALVAVRDLPLGGAVYGHQCVVVANDWHSALVPMFIHAEREADPSQWKDTKTAFLCHNAVFQGRFALEEDLAEVLNVPEHYVKSITFNMPLRVGKYNKKVPCVNSMAAGLRYSDRALTVSPSYARECAADPEKGVELEELFALGRITGVVNGVKEGVSPADKNFVTKTKMSCGTFTPATAVAAKEELKASYLAENGLPASTGPLLCFIGRLDTQKGYDLLLEALIEVLEDTEMQVVIVGAGRADLVAQTKAVEKKFPGKFYYGGWMGPERYALLAGCDYTLLPSRWEPCGLVQMEAMRMGTLPIVAPTGGLKDTVADAVNGLWTDSEMTVEAEIDEESVASIAKALRRAAQIHVETPEKEAEMKRAAMAAAAEFTWSNAALQYESIFDELNVVDVMPLIEDKTVTLEVDKQVC